MIADPDGSGLLGGPEGPRRRGFGGVCGVRVFAAIFPLLLSAAMTAGDENDFKLVSSPRSAYPAPEPARSQPLRLRALAPRTRARSPP